MKTLTRSLSRTLGILALFATASLVSIDKAKAAPAAPVTPSTVALSKSGTRVTARNFVSLRAAVYNNGATSTARLRVNGRDFWYQQREVGDRVPQFHSTNISSAEQARLFEILSQVEWPQLAAGGKNGRYRGEGPGREGDAFVSLTLRDETGQKREFRVQSIRDGAPPQFERAFDRLREWTRSQVPPSRYLYWRL